MCVIVDKRRGQCMFVAGVFIFALLGSVVIAIWSAAMGEKIKGVLNVSNVLAQITSYIGVVISFFTLYKLLGELPVI